MGPRERARVEAQAAVVDALIAGREVEAPGYFAATREAGAARRHSAAGARVLLLDGQLSCDPALRDRVDLAVHVTASREVLASRLADFYHWKGDDEDAVREMIAARLDHDLALVEGQQASADVVVDLGGRPELGDGAGHSGPV
jgi:uridine kinase